MGLKERQNIFMEIERERQRKPMFKYVKLTHGAKQLEKHLQCVNEDETARTVKSNLSKSYLDRKKRP